MSTAKRVLTSFLLVLALARAQSAEWRAGPLFDSFDLTLAPGHRTEALGPLFYFEEKETQQTWAVSPLFSYVRDPVTDFVEYDLAYPVLAYDRFGPEYRWHIFQVFSFAGGQSQQEQKAQRTTLFPLFFRQRSENPDLNYTALVPIYGHLKNRLLRDEIFFVLFPLYGQTRKKDVVTDNYLYPFFHLRHGNGLSGWQFWPLMGREHKEITTRTNSFDDVEKIGGHDKLFVLWPFFFKQNTGLGTDNPQRELAVLPLYNIERSPQRDSTSVALLFSHVTDREKKYSEWGTPWPLIVFAHGEGKTTSRVWPFFSHAENTNLVSDWYLWPVYKFNRVHVGALDRHRIRILLYLYSDVLQKNVETDEAQRRIDFWPLFTHKQDYDGSYRLQVFAPLEPILPGNKSIERNYSPLWSVWRAERNAKTGAASQSLLWNLYRHDVTPESKKCSLLFGLFQYQSGSEGKRLRLLYIPVVKTKPTKGNPEERM